MKNKYKIVLLVILAIIVGVMFWAWKKNTSVEVPEDKSYLSDSSLETDRIVDICAETNDQGEGCLK